MVTLSSDNLWVFGTAELINLIAAISTLAAVIVSLFLALKSKTIKYKVVINEKCPGLKIINTGDAKFLVDGFGILINGKYYINKHERFCKLLTNAKQLSQHQSTFQEISLGKVVLEPGDVAEVGLEGFDDFDAKSNHRVYLFLIISNRIKKYKLDVSKIEKRKNNNGFISYAKLSKKEVKQIGFYLS